MSNYVCTLTKNKTYLSVSRLIAYVTYLHLRKDSVNIPLSDYFQTFTLNILLWKTEYEAVVACIG